MAFSLGEEVEGMIVHLILVLVASWDYQMTSLRQPSLKELVWIMDEIVTVNESARAENKAEVSRP